MSDRPNPPVSPDIDLKDFAFTPIYRARLFGSSFHARANDAEWRAGLTLWLKSQDQVPAGSLPTDDIDLCRLAELGRDMKTWLKVRAMALHGWQECADGRLYHNDVAEFVNRVWNSPRRTSARVNRRLAIRSEEWAAIRRTVFERDSFTCQYCGERGGKLECDHVLPVAKGGKTEIVNLATACFRCNRSKGSRPLSAWLARHK